MVDMSSFNNPTEALQYAIDLYRNGDRAGAEEIYRSLLNHPDVGSRAVYLLGVSYLDQELLENAADCFSESIRKEPTFYSAQRMWGVTLMKMGRYSEGATLLQRIIQYSPEDASLYEQVATGFMQGEENEKAILFLEVLRELEPESAYYAFLKGLAHHKAGQYNSAIREYLQSIMRDDSDPVVFNNLGLVYQVIGDPENAMKEIKHAVGMKPDYADAYYNIANVLLDLEEYPAAEEWFFKAFSIDPALYDDVKLGELYYKQFAFDKALQCYESLLRKNPGDPSTLHNKALVLHELSRYDEEMKIRKDIVQRSPHTPDFRYSYSELLLLTGNYKEGWREYRSRKELPLFPQRTFLGKIYEGQQVRGKVILIYQEQGYGDLVQFLRYVKILHQLGAKTILLARAELLSMLKHQPYIHAAYLWHTDESLLPPYDYYCALHDLAEWLDQYEPSESTVPYLSVPVEKQKQWQDHLAGFPGLKVGLVVKAGSKIPILKQKSLTVEEASRIIGVKGCTIFNLQPGATVSDGVVDLSEILDDFSETAAAISAMDVVVTVDTVVAHIAGALGKECLLLLPFAADWRWGMKDQKNRWYPSIKKFQQIRKGDWARPVEDVARVLSGMSKPMSGLPVIFALPEGQNFGWGVCSDYLYRELKNLTEVHRFGGSEQEEGSIDGVVFHAMQNHDLKSLYKIRGTKNVGYIFFENELPENAVEAASSYDLILCGSTWNQEKFAEAGVHHTDTLIQGIDPVLFSSSTQEFPHPTFILFSGGKFELRKGQDLVLKAFSILSKKYRDILLINTWVNLWPHSMQTMQYSKHIKFELRGETHEEMMQHLYEANDINPQRVLTLPLIPNTDLREVYLQTDLGVFPNRCEGGTNLVLMEYMACGKPVVASYTSGHKDILTDRNSIPIKRMHPFTIENMAGMHPAHWEEPDLEELIAAIEYAYHNRETAKYLGVNAGEDMRNFTWKKSAEKLRSVLSRYQ